MQINEKKFHVRNLEWMIYKIDSESASKRELRDHRRE